jgi:hypothetical protein
LAEEDDWLFRRENAAVVAEAAARATPLLYLLKAILNAMVIPTIIPIIRLLCDVYLISYASIFSVGSFSATKKTGGRRKEKKVRERVTARPDRRPGKRKKRVW